MLTLAPVFGSTTVSSPVVGFPASMIFDLTSPSWPALIVHRWVHPLP